MILTVLSEKRLICVGNTLLKSRLHKIFGSTELAQLQFKMKVFLGSELVQGVTEMLFYHKMC